ncbi:SDR family NAD(P)-dependent oxidoreductase [Planctomycetota bacterium]|nr:SDR family NAD(P)-dependent oxidoreductase [Planctomycetota bacterium]
MTWNLTDIPNLTGKVAIVTGGNIGLGFESTYQLAKNGAHVIIACRSTEKGEAAIAKIKTQLPQASLQTIPLDLISAKSIEDFATTFTNQHDRLGILLNNAGVVNLEHLTRTPEGHEMHMATNHFGHFALTGLLYPTILKTENARVVTVSSGAAKWGEIQFDDLDWTTRPYSRVKSYGDSKLANLLFMIELQKHFENKGVSAISLSAHPGLTGTERQQTIGIGGKLSKWLASPVKSGVRPQLFAATSPDAQANDYYGPKFGIKGPPKNSPKFIAQLDRNLAQQLWQTTEQITGIKYE